MRSKSLHWMDRKPDPNIQRFERHSATHMSRPRMTSTTILSLLTLKSQLLGTKLDVLKEAESFEQQHNSRGVL